MSKTLRRDLRDKLDLARYLLTGKTWTARELANEMGVTKATVLSYVRRLRKELEATKVREHPSGPLAKSFTVKYVP